MFRNILNKSIKCDNYRITIRNYAYKPVKRPCLAQMELQKDSSNETTEVKEISLSAQIRAKIKMSGPITVAEYMKTVLTNPCGGYYMHRDVFGRTGDFITSPEITQIFGELIGVWMLQEWKKLGSKYPLQLVEFGPGRGTLMHDIMRVFHHFNISSKRVSVHLIEISPHMARLQALKLCTKTYETVSTEKNPIRHYREGEGIAGVKYYWYTSIDDLPKKKFSIFLAHEFFDALPIHKFDRSEKRQWREILVDFVEENEKEFQLVKAPGETPALKLIQPHLNDVAAERKHIEFSIESELIAESLAKRITMDGGIGLIVDYGHCGEKEDTFRAFKEHKLHNPMIEPGTADLTADVNFAHLKTVFNCGSRLITTGPINQGDFLKNMGGDLRLEMLLLKAKTDDIDNIKCAYDMLTNTSKGMADRFKFLALHPATTKQILEKYPVSGFYL